MRLQHVAASPPQSLTMLLQALEYLKGIREGVFAESFGVRRACRLLLASPLIASRRWMGSMPSIGCVCHCARYHDQHQAGANAREYSIVSRHVHGWDNDSAFHAFHQEPRNGGCVISRARPLGVGVRICNKTHWFWQCPDRLSMCFKRCARLL